MSTTTSQSSVFQTNILTIWERSRNPASRDAQVVAARRGAKKCEEVQWRHWQHVPGDIPAHRWEFPDGSDVLIADNGTIVEGKGRGHKVWSPSY